MGSANPSAITDKQRVAHMLQGLRGKAAKFFELNPDLVEKNSKEVSQIMEKRFGKASVVKLMDMSNIIQKPSESVMEFVARLRTAGEYIQEEQRDVTIVTQEEYDKIDPAALAARKVWVQEEYDKEMAIHRQVLDKYLLPFFLRGLRPEIKSVIIHKNPHTLDEAIREAETHERYAEAFGSFAQMNINNIDGTHESYARTLNAFSQLNLNNIDGKVLEEAAQQLKGLNTNNPPPFLQRQDAGKKTEDRNCFNCGKKGHLKRDCQQPRPSMPRSSNGKTRLQPRMRDLREPGAENSNSPLARNRSEYIQRAQNSLNRRVTFERDANAPRKYQGFQSNELTYRQQARKQTEGSEHATKNGVRPPQRGGLTLPSPLRRGTGRGLPGKEPSRH